LQIADGGGRAPVDAGQVAERVQLIDPGTDEALDGGAAGRGVLVVALHVEVDRAAGAEAERGGVAGGVVGRGGALARGDRGRDLREAPAADARRLEADVERDQAPAGGDGGGGPAGGEADVRAGAVDAADVDAECPVRGLEPGGQRVSAGRVAGVEGVSGEYGAPRRSARVSRCRRTATRESEPQPRGQQ